jgi:hypothetical protein
MAFAAQEGVTLVAPRAIDSASVKLQAQTLENT